MNRRRQVCLFGLSANPPTGDGGHRGIALALSQMSRFDEIRILPVYRHTFSSKRNSLASYEDRMAMCRLAFKGIANVEVSNAEERSFRQKVRNDMTEEDIKGLRVGTADLLEMLLSEEPNIDFTFCLGTDTFMDLTNFKWRRSKDILSLLDGRLVVLHRKGVTKNDEVKKRLKAVNGSEGNGNVLMLQITSLQDISSTSVRSISEEETLKKMVTPEVLQYMKHHKLYSFGGIDIEN